jgi:hypothetical protein
MSQQKDRKSERDQNTHGEPIGDGMTSSDSTQMPLRADTGEPDWQAVRGKNAPEQGGAGDRSSASGGTNEAQR